jgi:sterol desaturase/sphingolipid hydroxylase (fatty acid hydroxylase superfamily)
MLLLIPLSAVDGWLRMHDIVRPGIEDLIPALGRNSVGVFVVYLVMLDFIDYWVHRLQHRVRWWWALHSLHHSQRQMSFWADDRNHLLDDVLTSGVVAFAALLIGVHSSQFILFVVLSRMLQSLSHVNARLHFGSIGNRILVSPVYHRLHHAIGVGHEGGYQGCNFATLFPLWDMLFRTANFKREYLATGVRDQLEGHDYGSGFWRQQWLGLIRMRAALARRRAA